MSEEFYKEELKRLKETSNFRALKDIKQEGKFILLDNKKLLNFSSNDYLGISSDAALRREFLHEFLSAGEKISTPSARLLTGTDSIYKETEEFLASLLNKERALLFNSGYHGNVGVYSALLGPEDVVFVDKLNHASIIDGIRLSKAKIIPYKHLDYGDLRHKLELYRSKFKKAIISTETLFSMDGDLCNLNELYDLKREFNALLIVDEAHSFGVYGSGRGVAFEQGALDKVDLLLATFGKALGSYGAFVAGSGVLIDYLINFARSFIFSTTLPLISIRFANYVLKNRILNSNVLQNKLFHLSKLFRTKLEVPLSGESFIVPVILGENERAVNFSNSLIEKGFYVLPIRYPTVAKNTARLRISINSSLEEEDAISLAEAINSLLQTG